MSIKQTDPNADECTRESTWLHDSYAWVTVAQREREREREREAKSEREEKRVVFSYLTYLPTFADTHTHRHSIVSG